MPEGLARSPGPLSQPLVAGRPCSGHPHPHQPGLPEAVCVPVSTQGLEVLAVIDPLAAARTHGQLTSCKDTGSQQPLLGGVVWCRSGLPGPPHGDPAPSPARTQSTQMLCLAEGERTRV